MAHARIFVTGAESFVGRALQAACAADNVALAGIDLAPSSHNGARIILCEAYLTSHCFC